MTPVPVQLELCSDAAGPDGKPTGGVVGTCTRCGRCVKLPLPPRAHGKGLATRIRDARAAVLADLTARCPQPLPWGLPPVHADRGVPRGVTVWAVEAATGDRLAVAVGERGRLETAWAGVSPGAEVLVVPESDDYAMAAVDYCAELVRRGYARARVGKPERAKAVKS